MNINNNYILCCVMLHGVSMLGQISPCAVPTTLHFRWLLLSLQPSQQTCGKYYPHLMEEETEAQWGDLPWRGLANPDLRSHSSWVQYICYFSVKQPVQQWLSYWGKKMDSNTTVWRRHCCQTGHIPGCRIPDSSLPSGLFLCSSPLRAASPPKSRGSSWPWQVEAAGAIGGALPSPTGVAWCLTKLQSLLPLSC